MENKFIKTIIYSLMKIGNILIGIPISLASTIVVLAICLVDLVLSLLPVALILSIFIQEIDMGIGPNNFIVKILAVIIGTAMGYYLYQILKVYVPKYFEFLKMYLRDSFKFSL